MSGLSVAVVVGAGVAGPPAASVLPRGQDVVLYGPQDRLGGRAHSRQPSLPPARGGGARAGARSTYGLPGIGRHPRGLAVAEPHPVAPDANGSGDEGTVPARAVPARTVHEQPVRPRPVPETREGLL
ncbi:NAD(P)-binding protein [Streptomyces goshikiensis]|uniref:NAD(P)-binding protein n=1 Tax=Streptomyces goshikiensis TaxID=1942 RepID=UPI0037941228